MMDKIMCSCMSIKWRKSFSWSKKSVMLILITFALIDKASSQHSCQSKSDCLLNECCVAQQHGQVGKCEKMLSLNAQCFQQYDIKFIFLGGGGIGTNKCGCQSGLVCTRLERNNWKQKVLEWSEEERQKKTKYKFRCRPIPDEADELTEHKR